MNWLERITESKANKEARLLKELSESPEFKELVADSARNLVDEAKRSRERAARKEHHEHKVRLEAAKKHVTTVADSMKDSNEPFCILLGMDFTKENGIKVSLDYNDAFIRYLNAQGVQGDSDEGTITQWLAMLSHDIAEQTDVQDYIMNGVSEDETPSLTYDEMFGMDTNGTPMDDGPIQPDDEWERE